MGKFGLNGGYPTASANKDFFNDAHTRYPDHQNQYREGNEAKQQHKRMQSLVTDPQFISQPGVNSGDSGTVLVSPEFSKAIHGHTTKNNGTNPKMIFAQQNNKKSSR